MKLRGTVTSAERYGGLTCVHFDDDETELWFPGDVSTEFTPGQEVEVSVTAVGAEAADRDAVRLAFAVAEQGEALLESLGEYVRQSMHFNPEWRRGVDGLTKAVREFKMAAANPSEAAGEARPAPQPCVNSCRFVLRGADWCGPCRDAHASQGKRP